MVLISPHTSRRVLPRYQTIQQNLDNTLLIPYDTTNRSPKFVAIWNKSMNQVVYGKIVGHLNDYIILEYWVNSFLTNTISPSLQNNIVTKCSGCVHHEQFYNTHHTSFGMKHHSSCCNRYYLSTAVHIPIARHLANSQSYDLTCSTFLIKQQSELLYNSLTTIHHSPISPSVNLSSSTTTHLNHI